MKRLHDKDKKKKERIITNTSQVGYIPKKHTHLKDSLT